MISAPPIDDRTAEDIVRDLRRLQGWEWDRDDRGPNEALSRIFARYCEILLDRLNRAPDRNFIAFLDILGVSLLPAQPARVPLTFYPSARTDSEVIVPELTQVAALPAKGDTRPIIFETEREVVLVSARLDSLYVRDGSRGLYADYTPLLAEPGSESVPAFRGNLIIPHSIYLGLRLPTASPTIASLTFSFTLDAEAQTESPRPWLSWELWDGKQVYPVQPAKDGTEGFGHSGDVTFENLVAIPEAEIDGVRAQWIRCRLLTAFEISQPQFPPMRQVKVRSVVQRDALPASAAFYNTVPVDLSKEFFPFGERPRLADTLYLAADEALATPGAEVTVRFDVVNPAGGGTDLPARAVTANRVRLRWEIWNGSDWIPLEGPQFKDNVDAFAKSGSVSFRLPFAAVPRNLYGVEHRWLRVRILAGNYGQEGTFEVPPGSPTPVFRPGTPAPPVLGSVRISYSITTESAPAAIVTWNDFRWAHLPPGGPGAPPFAPSQDPQPACYLGFETTRFVARSMSIYIGISYPMRGEAWPQELEQSAELTSWEYWNGEAWMPWIVRDETMGLRRSGIVRFLAPPDFRGTFDFGRERYWLRVRRKADVPFEPRLTMVLLNTAMASQTFTTRNEILGSGNGRPLLVLRCSRAPVLEGQVLEILERESNGAKTWKLWQQTTTFSGCGPLDPVYVFENSTGRVFFGDGVRGAIPPEGISNIRMTRYMTGGGPDGNRDIHTITQLKTSVPYVDKVTNHKASMGGAAAEKLEDLLERGPRELRHRGRAVTAEDYEDLARRSTGEVAHAHCVPLIDLGADPAESHRAYGVVSIIIVPRLTEPAPVPSLELLDRVRRYLDDRRTLGVRLVLVGPEYVRTDIDAQVVISDLEAARDIELRVKLTIMAYLHPVTGRDGQGWVFGERPKSSEIYALIESAEGVDHVRSLEMKFDPVVTRTKRALVYAGEIRVSASLEK